MIFDFGLAHMHLFVVFAALFFWAGVTVCVCVCEKVLTLDAIPSPSHMMLACTIISWLAASSALAPPLQPSLSPKQTVPLSSDRDLLLHVPEDDEIMEAFIREAQVAAANAADDDEFDAIMEAHTTAQPPAYWAQVWPSAVAMARRLCDEMDVTSGATVLELGCGLGVASIAAALAGAKSVVATDVEQHALTYAAANADLNCVAREVFRTAKFDWRDVSPPLPGASSMDVVLLADCVYDEEAPQLLSRVLHATVSLGGKVMLTDNADRPYESRRRDALVEALCGGPSADFELDRQFTTEVCLKTRQGERFQISHVDLIRVAIGE